MPIDTQTTRIITCTDWSPNPIDGFPSYVPSPMSADSTSPYQMGIYSRDHENYYTTGYVGIGRLVDHTGNSKTIECEDGIERELVLRVNPRFRVDPWKMLATVMQDSEYSSYVGRDPEKFFKINVNEKTIEVPTNESGGELLLAMSFVSACHSICKKNLKPNMAFEDNNYNGKVKGKILFGQHFKSNLVNGRADKVYCRHTVFSIDTLENRVLKAALYISKRIIADYKNKLGSIDAMMHFCEDSLKNVSSVFIMKSDFANIKVTGFNSYYAPAMKLAKHLISHTSISIVDNDLFNKKEVIPYVIKMESLFEFYIRSLIKTYIEENHKENEVYIEKYAKRFGTMKPGEIGNVYLMKNYIPDLAIMDPNNDSFIAVLDAKYQPYIIRDDDNRKRHNSHQLLFYALLLNARKCGFVFPMSGELNDNNDTVQSELDIQTGNLNISNIVKYSQWLLSGEDSSDQVIISNLLDWILNE